MFLVFFQVFMHFKAQMFDGKHESVLKYYGLSYSLASEVAHPPAPSVATVPHAFGSPHGLQTIRPTRPTGSQSGHPVKTQATPLPPEFCHYL